MEMKRQSSNFLKYIKELIYEFKNLDEELFEKIQVFINSIGTGVFIESKLSS